MNKFRTAVIVGRFQTPYLHDGHIHLLNSAKNYPNIRDVVVILGCQKEVDARNPYSFDYRKSMILDILPHAIVTFINDVPDNNEAWSRELDYIIEHFDAPLLFGSRDSFYSSYKGFYPYQAVTEIPDVSATQIRNEMTIMFKEPMRTKSLRDMVFEVSAAVPERDIRNVMIKLSEEVGELSKEVNVYTGFDYREEGKDGVIGEVIDVINCALDLIWLVKPNITNKEIEDIMANKLAKWERNANSN